MRVFGRRQDCLMIFKKKKEKENEEDLEFHQG
jgi:hypothetical protein